MEEPWVFAKMAGFGTKLLINLRFGMPKNNLRVCAHQVVSVGFIPSLSAMGGHKKLHPMMDLRANVGESHGGL